MSEPHHTRREQPDVDTLRILGVTFGFLLFVAIGMAVLATFYHQKTGAYRVAPPVAFPAPQLQTDPAADLRKLQTAQRAELARNDWADPGHTLRRIPIEHAMSIIAARGAHAYDPIGDRSAAPPGPSSP